MSDVPQAATDAAAAAERAVAKALHRLFLKVPVPEDDEFARAAVKAAAPHLRCHVAAEFYRDVEALMGDYRDDSRDIIAAVPFAASLMQLACEKYGITL